VKYLTLLILLIFLSCGKTTDEKVAEAIDTANQCLNTRQCDCAIKALNSVGMQNENALYITTLAGARACYSDFDEPTFVGTNVAFVGSPSTLGGTTRFTTSSTMTTPAHLSYSALQNGIDTFLYAGGLSTTASPTSALRGAIFSAANISDMDAHLLYMLFAQLGKFLYYYGNPDTAGVKGAGSGTNGCIANYENVPLTVGVDLTTYLGLGATGSCNTLSEGHADLGAAGSLNISRACQAIVNFNNVLDVLPSVIASVSGNDLSTLNTALTAINAAKAAAIAAKPAMSALFLVTSQSECVTNYSSAANDDILQVYIAFMFEFLFT
jgi:hypothetical protein